MNELADLDIQVSVGLRTVICCTCGSVFAMAATLQEDLRKTHKPFWCPTGHQQHYGGESEAERLRRELERERQRTTRLLASFDQASAEVHELTKERTTLRAHKTRLERKVASTLERATNGVCTECHRSFGNVARHMQTKHPAAVVHAVSS